jgi:hypothetical protein
VTCVPGRNDAEVELPLDTLMPDGLEVTLPPLPVAVTPILIGKVVQAPPQVRLPPQPSDAVPHVVPWAAQVVGVQDCVGLAFTVRMALTVTLPPAVMVADTEPEKNAVVPAVNDATV